MGFLEKQAAERRQKELEEKQRHEAFGESIDVVSGYYVHIYGEREKGVSGNKIILAQG